MIHCYTPSYGLVYKAMEKEKSSITAPLNVCPLISYSIGYKKINPSITAFFIESSTQKGGNLDVFQDKLKLPQ
jgi:hypothetical protein